jgi:hypothetical protein
MKMIYSYTTAALHRPADVRDGSILLKKSVGATDRPSCRAAAGAISELGCGGPCRDVGRSK